MAHVSGPTDNPDDGIRRNVIRSYYYDYKRDWHKTH